MVLELLSNSAQSKAKIFEQISQIGAQKNRTVVSAFSFIFLWFQGTPEVLLDATVIPNPEATIGKWAPPSRMRYGNYRF